MTLSQNSIKLLKFYWTTDARDPEFILRAVQAGVNPARFVEETIKTIREIGTPPAIREADSMQQNFDEACQVVAGIIGLV